MSSATPATILLVDDQPANLLALEAILEPLGYRLLRAASGDEALRLLLKEDVALILLDVQMPGMDGFETATLLKSRPRTRHIPVIFITALSRDATHIFKGYGSGAVDYILKPYNADILRSKVSVFVELYQRGEEIKRQAALLLQRESEEMERRNERRIRQLTDAMPLCVWAMRPDGVTYYGNHIWAEYVGGPPESGRDLLAQVHPDDAMKVRTAWQNALRSGSPFEMEYRVQRQGGGAYRWMLGRAVPEKDEQGQLTGWIATATDIDHQKNEAQALTQARHVAETANRAKDEFLATISHELRTPLTAILAWSSMLKTRMNDPDRLARGIEIIDRNARAQRNLIEDLLDMSRIISGKLQLNVSVIDPRAVIAAAVDTVRNAGEAKHVELKLDLDGVPPAFRADPDRLQQIVWNLVANAVKFSMPGGRVDVSARAHADKIILRVRDNGKGIDAEGLPRLFDRFWQEDSTSTRATGGLGLGLAIVRYLVELHGGTVRAESDGPGKGALFTVELPLQGAVTASPTAPPPEPDARALDHVRVLLVEDDPDGRETISMMLEDYGAEVHAVASAEDALVSLPKVRPDVLLSDLGLPREDGYSLLRRVRALTPSDGGAVPAVALSAYASADDRRRALDAGFQMHVAKPAEPAQLAGAIARAAHL